MSFLWLFLKPLHTFKYFLKRGYQFIIPHCCLLVSLPVCCHDVLPIEVYSPVTALSIVVNFLNKVVMVAGIINRIYCLLLYCPCLLLLSLSLLLLNVLSLCQYLLMPSYILISSNSKLLDLIITASVIEFEYYIFVLINL